MENLERQFFSVQGTSALFFKKYNLFFILVLCLFLSFQHKDLHAEEIIIGQSCDLSGPNKALGLAIREGAKIYFEHINAKGGIHGKKIKFISLDDKYQAGLCKKNTELLIEKHKALVLFGYVGTEISQTVKPLVQEKQIPFFAPLTGAMSLRQPVIPEVFHIRASYFQEIEAMVEQLVLDKKNRRIAVFHQDDASGQDGLRAVNSALNKHGLSPIVITGYNPENPVVEKAAERILSEKPDALIMIATSIPSAELISTMRKNGSDTIFMNVSIVNGEVLAGLLMNYGLGVVVSQVVPFPLYRRLPLVAEYNQILSELSPDTDPCFVSLEGFIAAKALCNILAGSDNALSRKGFIKETEKQRERDLGGFNYSFSEDEHQGSNMVFLTQIGPGGFLRPISKLSELYKFYSQNP